MTQVDGPAVDLRVCFIPSVLGESVTLRILARNQVILGLEELQYAPHDFARIQRALSHPWGLIVCAGPTGCGKTTLLYSCLNRVTGPATKVMSIEDPVEFVLPQVVQIPLNSRAGLTFSVAMRSILRSDPDVIMVGEIRDVETLNISFQAALTGHLVLTTLHTPDAASTLIRMVNIGSPEFLVTDATRLIIAQRLVRRVCPECSVAQKPTGEQLERARARATAGGLVWEKMPAKFRSARGCAKCVQLGYRGRTVVAEVLEVTPEIAASLRRGAGAEELTAIAVRQGMTSMGADAIRRAGNGDTTLEEALRVTGSR
jgi:type IV pilus assembly protein PilB